MKESNKKGLTYADAGVDINAGAEAVELMKEHVKKTFRPEVMTDLGGSGGSLPSIPASIRSLSWFPVLMV